MDVDKFLSSLISSNYTTSTCTPQPQFVKMKVPGDQVSKNCVDVKFTENGENKETTKSSVPPEEITSPSTVSPNFLLDDPISLLSTGSTDLSRYLASGSSLLLPTNNGGTGDDEASSTAAESVYTVTETTTDNKSSNVNVKSSSPERRKLTRSASFTVETPTFKNLPSCDSTSHSVLNAQISTPATLTSSVEGGPMPKWCLAQETPPSPITTSAVSPVVSNQVAERTMEILNCDDDLRDFDAAKVEEQLKRLKNMQLMLAEYHRLQLDHLKLRQKDEVETLKTQVECMEKILTKLVKPKTPCLKRPSTCTVSSPSVNSVKSQMFTYSGAKNSVRKPWRW